MERKLKKTIHDIIFGTNSFYGKAFDVVLIIIILISVLLVVLSSIQYVHDHFQTQIGYLEWVFTLIFTIEYALRIYCSASPRAYIFSFYGCVDLVSLLPTYLAIFFPDTHYLMVIRLIRVLRIFRVLKLIRYVKEGDLLLRAILSSRRKILVFFCFVLVMAIVYGSLMFAIEGPVNGFSSIPKSIYWAIVTITTVGYGDITPQTIPGQILAGWVMITGYTVIAVPMGIYTVELSREMRKEATRICPKCNKKGHEHDAKYCRHCGSILNGR